jgi:uncharacterized membrane protein
MKPDTPITLAVAQYGSRDAAVSDFKTVLGAKHEGEFDHMSVAVLTKDTDGKLQVERHDTTAKHLAWVGAALVVVAPPVGVAAVAGGAGVGALVGHFWHNIPADKINEAAEVLEAGESGLVVVAVNKKGTDIKPLLARAEKCSITETEAGDLDSELDKELRAAKEGVAKAAASS